MSGWQVAALIVAAWFSLCACLLCGWMAWVTLADSSHRRRRGGYIRLRPSASSVASRVGRYTTAGTAAAEANGSSSTRPGQAWAATATRLTQPKPSRTTAPTSCGSDPAGTNPGDNTTDAPEPCDQKGCHRLGTQRVLTNYGYLGTLCSYHYIELVRGMSREGERAGLFPPWPTGGIVP